MGQTSCPRRAHSRFDSWGRRRAHSILIHGQTSCPQHIDSWGRRRAHSTWIHGGRRRPTAYGFVGQASCPRHFDAWVGVVLSAIYLQGQTGTSCRLVFSVGDAGTTESVMTDLIDIVNPLDGRCTAYISSPAPLPPTNRQQASLALIQLDSELCATPALEESTLISLICPPCENTCSQSG